jgi:hypothetical protein
VPQSEPAQPSWIEHCQGAPQAARNFWPTQRRATPSLTARWRAAFRSVDRDPDPEQVRRKSVDSEPEAVGDSFRLTGGAGRPMPWWGGGKRSKPCGETTMAGSRGAVGLVCAHASTLRAGVEPAKLQFHADPMGRLESGAAAPGGSGPTRTIAIPTRGCPAGSDQVRAARSWRAASVLTRAGARTRRFSRPGTGVLRPAPG